MKVKFLVIVQMRKLTCCQTITIDFFRRNIKGTPYLLGSEPVAVINYTRMNARIMFTFLLSKLLQILLLKLFIQIVVVCKV
jgi:hypothetical protein